jgi:hypothetical protein
VGSYIFVSQDKDGKGSERGSLQLAEVFPSSGYCTFISSTWAWSKESSRRLPLNGRKPATEGSTEPLLELDDSVQDGTDQLEEPQISLHAIFASEMLLRRDIRVWESDDYKERLQSLFGDW